jgi:hypothetical protein
MPPSLGCTTKQRSIPFGYSFTCPLRVVRVPFCVLWSLFSFYRYAEGPRDCETGVFIAKDVDGIGEKGSVVPTVVDVGGGGGRANLEALLNMSLRSICFSDEAFYSSGEVLQTACTFITHDGV